MGLGDAPYPARVVADGAVAYWRLNEATGPTAHDLIGTAHGTITAGGVTRAQPGAIVGDAAMAFDGLAGRVRVPRGPFMEWGTGAHSLELWLRPTADAPGTWLLDTANNGTAQPGLMFIQQASGLVAFYGKTTAGGSRLVGAPITVGEWVHLVGVIERGAVQLMTLYANGVAVGSTPLDPAFDFSPGADHLALGGINQDVGATPGYSLPCVLDDVAIYAHALVAAQVAEHFALASTPANEMALMYAQGGVARGGATRGNYHGTGVFISIGGVEYGDGRANKAHRVLRDSLTITDALNEDPNTCAMRTKGFVPPIGAELVIRLGSRNNLRHEFAGRVLQTTQAPLVDDPLHHGDTYAVAAIDATWDLNRRKVIARYTGTATVIAQQLIAEWAPAGFSSAAVAPDLPLVDDGITFTHQDLTDCLTQLAKRVGASWFVDYHQVLHFFLIDTSTTDPQPLTLAHPTARELAITRDVSQWATRAMVEGGGVSALTDVMLGDTLIPVQTVEWYPPTGGLVSAGPQHVRYGGVRVGGTGALVGYGAQPSVALLTAPAVGGAIEYGTHGYAYTFETALGESLISPITVNPALLAGPPTAPTVSTPGVGVGPDTGTHDYAVTFITPTGETAAGPRVSATTGVSAPPAAAPTPTPTSGSGLTAPATYDYVVTFRTPAGETTPGPVSSTVTTAPQIPTAPAPAMMGNGPNATFCDLIPTNVYAYAVAWSTAGSSGTHTAQTGLVNYVTAQAQLTTSTITNAGAPPGPSNGPNSGQGDLTVGHAYDYAITYSVAPASTDHTRETTVTAASPMATATASTAGGGKSSTMTVQVGYYNDSRVLWAHLYRRNRTTQPANVNAFRLVTSIPNVPSTGVTSYGDLLADAAIIGHVAPPTANTTAGGNKASHILIDIPYGPAGVTWCHLYRVNQTAVPSSSAGDYRLLTSVANGAAPGVVRFTDTVADSAIAGASAGSSPNTTPATAQVTLTSVPKGGSGSGVIARRLYRRQATGAFGFVGEVADNTTTTVTDALTTPGAAPPIVNTALAQQLTLTTIPLGGPLVTERVIYRTRANDPTLAFLAAISDNTTTTFVDTLTDADLIDPGPPAIGTAWSSAVQLSAIGVGPPAVLARRLYRTAADGSTLLALAIVADNTTTTYLDELADAALGAAAPTDDLSGLKQPEGSVNAGATVLPVSGAAWAPPTGGWVIIGNGAQVVRYHGLSGNTLIGIPATGTGAVTATISFNSSITLAPMLTDIPASGAEAIRVPLVKGDDVNLIVIVDDVASQAALAALIGGDGVQEAFLQDRRLSAGEAIARGEALLALTGQLAITVHYTARDLNSHAGRPLVVDLGPPFNLSTTLRIQRSTATYALAKQLPLYSVEASSSRFSFEDLLRMARLTRGT